MYFDCNLRIKLVPLIHQNTCTVHHTLQCKIVDCKIYCALQLELQQNTSRSTGFQCNHFPILDICSVQCGPYLSQSLCYCPPPLPIKVLVDQHWEGSPEQYPISDFYLMYLLICQKPAHSLSAQMDALSSSFILTKQYLECITLIQTQS